MTCSVIDSNVSSIFDLKYIRRRIFYGTLSLPSWYRLLISQIKQSQQNFFIVIVLFVTFVSCRKKMLVMYHWKVLLRIYSHRRNSNLWVHEPGIVSFDHCKGFQHLILLLNYMMLHPPLPNFILFRIFVSLPNSCQNLLNQTSSNQKSQLGVKSSHFPYTPVVYMYIYTEEQFN